MEVVMSFQYDFFEPNTKEFLLEKEIIEIREQQNKQRKSMFVRLGNQEKIIMKLMQEVEDMRTLFLERKK